MALDSEQRQWLCGAVGFVLTMRIDSGLWTSAEGCWVVPVGSGSRQLQLGITSAGSASRGSAWCSGLEGVTVPAAVCACPAGLGCLS
jgi:hypothetical protein